MIYNFGDWCDENNRPDINVIKGILNTPIVALDFKEIRNYEGNMQFEGVRITLANGDQIVDVEGYNCLFKAIGFNMMTPDAQLETSRQWVEWMMYFIYICSDLEQEAEEWSPIYPVEPICQTPGAVYNTKINRKRISVTVTFPESIGDVIDKLTEDDTRVLEQKLHDQLEKNLIFLWRRVDLNQKV